MFDSKKLADLTSEVEELNRKLENVLVKFRALETEWLDTRSKFESIIKRSFRAFQTPQPNSHNVETVLTPEVIQSRWGGPGGPQKNG